MPRSNLKYLAPVAFIVLMTHFACTNVSSRSVSAAGGANSDSSAKLTAAAARTALIKELKKLHSTVVSGDKHRIAGLFSFPLPDSVANFFMDDSVYRQEVEKHTEGLPESVFLNYFDKIAALNMDLEEFNKVFTYLDVNKLQHTDSLRYNAIVKTEPCYRYYSLQIENDSLVDVVYGINSNSDYVRKKEDEDESDGACEHTTFWYFAFDGKKLRLTKQGGAD
jgi:hypothetical protein